MTDDNLLGGRYRRGESVGSGAMGEVWLAHDELLGRRVAVKQLRMASDPDPAAADRMLREARVAARLHHPNVVSVFDLVVQGGEPHVVMEFVEGETLADRVRREGRLGEVEAARVIGQVAAALAAAARAGVVHRDVKPANVLMGTDGSVKLADFGIARGAQDLALTDTGQMLGTVAYMAPEVARTGLATAASDVWSLGATLYACVEGHAPHAGGEQRNVTTILARLITEPVVAPENAGALTPALMRMLDADPERRPTAVQVVGDLATISGATPAPVEVTRLRATPVLAEPDWMTGPTGRRPVVEAAASTVHRTAVAGPPVLPPGPGAADRRRSGALVLAAAAASVIALASVAAVVLWVVLGDRPAATVASPAVAVAVPAATTVPGTSETVPTSATEPVAAPPATTEPPPVAATPRAAPSVSRPPVAPETVIDYHADYVAGADAQGFLDAEGARCNAADPAVFTGYTAESLIVVCVTADDRYYYKGVRTRDGADIELDDPVPTAEGFTAYNGETVYDLAADGFTITSPAGEQLTYQPWIQYTSF